MRVHAQKQSQPQKEASLHSSRFTHHTTRNQAAQVLSHANAEDRKMETVTFGTPRFGHNFSRIPVYSKAPVRLQAKLTINTPGDIYEQEAERTSEQVTSMPEPQLQRTCACGGGCPKCRNEQASHKRLQTKRVQSSDYGEIEVPPIVHEVLHSSGQPLNSSTREFMESRFDHDFSRVRVHTDAKAAASAGAVNALAYTIGHDVVFGAGQYQPETSAGKRLLAHELTHTVQQANGFQTKLAINKPGDQYEREAERTALAVAQGGPSPVYVQTGAGVMRQLMRQQAKKPKAVEPEEDLIEKKPKGKVSQTFNHEVISSDLRKLKNLNISGSIVSTSSDVKTLSNGIRTLRPVIQRMDQLSISQQSVQDINSKVSALNNSLNVDVTIPLGIVKQQSLLGSFSAASLTGAESIPVLVTILEILGEIVAAIAAILEAPIVVIIAVIALVIWLIYEIIMAIVEAADQALCMYFYVQCIERRKKITYCEDCRGECEKAGGIWPGKRCPIPGLFR